MSVRDERHWKKIVCGHCYFSCFVEGFFPHAWEVLRSVRFWSGETHPPWIHSCGLCVLCWYFVDIEVRARICFTYVLCWDLWNLSILADGSIYDVSSSKKDDVMRFHGWTSAYSKSSCSYLDERSLPHTYNTTPSFLRYHRLNNPRVETHDAIWYRSHRICEVNLCGCALF